MMENKITCIVCPRGCTITKAADGTISGYFCKRGLDYATQEFVSPKRGVTSFIRTNSGKIICVKTSKDIDKKLIFKVMEILNDFHPEKDDFKVGDVLIKNILDTGVDIVCTRG